MPVRYRKDRDTWLYRFQINGYSYSEEGFQTKLEAENAEAACLLSSGSVPSSKLSKLPFPEASLLFFNQYSLNPNNIKDPTLHKGRIAVLNEIFKHKLLNGFKDEDVTFMRTKLAMLGCGDLTQNHYQALIKGILNWFKDRKKTIVDNPFATEEMIEVPKARVRYMKPEEEALITPLVKDSDIWPYYLVALYTGLRINNICNIKVENIDFHLGQIFIPKSKNGASGYIPIDDRLLPWIKEWASNKRGDERLIGTFTRWPVSKRWRIICDKAKVKDLVFHDLRHTFAWDKLRKGVPLYIVSKLLLHKNQKTTEEHYGHMVPQDFELTLRAILRNNTLSNVGYNAFRAVK